MPEPLDAALYKQVKLEADQKFLAPTSAYKSAWIVKEYKKRGGLYAATIKYDKVNRLTKWFAEKWVDISRPEKSSDGSAKYAPCGRSRALPGGGDKYPLCRPSKRVDATTPKTVAEIDKSRVKRLIKEKQQIRENGRVKF